ncbi:hypothetical protein FISHEDRAFT_70432 [Fistulina hepatica ATCC 64428]|uniref:Asl1-like glycosyl hydrolase catalytic domain-containing protein n=1 Tax=Fistulina hepatica ATCC 64428 TaxID=1128425 RepID=A0A0D7AJA4_9AGAR|nr:hypothetical protein FISHEDRAFT_70432 [Fistulina hepatica ATCC 64428]
MKAATGFSLLAIVVAFLAVPAFSAPIKRTPVKRSSTKRGLAWPWDGLADDFDLFSSSTTSWEYNWESWTNSPPAGITYVAMQRTSEDIDTLAASMESTGATILLGFNEPDNTDQANLSPSDAASLWIEYMNPIHESGIHVVAPAITNSDESGQGIDWMTEFVSACGGSCLYDEVAMHWYGDTLDDFEAQVEAVASTFDSTVWVTEFALNDSADDDTTQTFLTDAISYLESSDSVSHYSWFVAGKAVCCCALIVFI